MKVIAIAAVTAGGKTTVVNEIKKRLPRTAALYFDDYSFDGEVENFYQWVLDGADYQVWDLSQLEKDILAIRDSGRYDTLLLDYPFAYRNDRIKKYIDVAVFIDTPLDIAMARRVLRDFKDATADEIRGDMEMYLKVARVAYVQMLKDILPSSDYVIDGTKDLERIVNEVIKICTETEKKINCMSDIKEYIFKELSLHEQKTALEFIEYLENVGCSFYKDASACWKDKIYYWVKFGEKCVCFIAIKDPDEPENHWTVWSDDMDSEYLGKYPVNEKTREIAYKYVGHCGHCGSCGGGRHKVIFGKEFNDICGCTFRIDNPTFDDLLFLKKIVEIRIKEIQSKK